MRTRPAFLDFIIIAAVCAVAIALFALPFLRPEGQTVTVSVRRGGTTEMLCEYELMVEQSFTVENNGITLTVVIKGGSVSVTHGDCDDRICVNSGKISRSGQSIICAPAGIVITVSGGEVGEDISAG